MSQDLSTLLAILVTLAAGVISPGPSFVMVARMAVSSLRADGVAAALGMGAGGVVFALAALLGLQGLLLAVPSLYFILKLGGGLYLVYLGMRIWGSSHSIPLSEVDLKRRSTPLQSFSQGFATQISNPKTAVVYASVFAAFLPPAPTFAFDSALLVLVFAIEAGWYAVVALALSSDRPRSAYLRSKAWIDRAAGGVMIALGAKLVWSARDA